MLLLRKIVSRAPWQSRDDKNKLADRDFSLRETEYGLSVWRVTSVEDAEQTLLQMVLLNPVFAPTALDYLIFESRLAVGAEFEIVHSRESHLGALADRHYELRTPNWERSSVALVSTLCDALDTAAHSVTIGRIPKKRVKEYMSDIQRSPSGSSYSGGGP